MAQAPIPLLSFLCPSNTKDFKRSTLYPEYFSHTNKEKMIPSSQLLGKHYQKKKKKDILIFYYFRITKFTLLFLFLPVEEEMQWYTFLPKPSQQSHNYE